MRYYTWLKHELMYEALQIANEIFFFDADVVIFRNPWPEVTYGRDETGVRIKGEYDIMYQRERGMRVINCGGSVNSGQLYINKNRNKTLIKQYFQLLYERKYKIIYDSSRLDQDHVSDIVPSLLKYCTLPVKRFQGHCTWSQDLTAKWNEIISYHSSCANSHQKKQILKNVLIGQETQLNKMRPMDQILSRFRNNNLKGNKDTV